MKNKKAEKTIAKEISKAIRKTPFEVQLAIWLNNSEIVDNALLKAHEDNVELADVIGSFLKKYGEGRIKLKR